MFFKKLFYASAAVLMLALAYHLGASTATAQAPSNPVVAAFLGASTTPNTVVTANGDVYTLVSQNGDVYRLASNIFSGAPVPTHQSSWGALKGKAR